MNQLDGMHQSQVFLQVSCYFLLELKLLLV
jgi:hypothetical protein